MEGERGRSDPGHCPEFKDYLLAINSQHAIVGRRALSYETIISARSVGCTTSGQPLVVSSLLQLVI
jgi:hypothetical protein